MKPDKWISVNSATSDSGVSNKQLIETDFTPVLTDASKTGKTHIRYSLNGLWEEDSSFDGQQYATLKAAEIGQMQEEGAPALPQEGLFIALPANAAFKELKIVDYKLQELEGEVLILPAPKPAFEGQPLIYTRDEAIYQSDTMYPGKIAEYMGTKEIGGIQVAHILLYPAQYFPLSRKISLLDFADLEISYEIDGRDFTFRPQRMNKAFSSLILGYEEPEVKDEPGNKPATDSDSLKAPENHGEFIIITTNDLKSSFDGFVATKSSKYKVKVVTKEAILAEFPDPQETAAIKKFLQYAYGKWATAPKYVILGGNIDKIPTYFRNHGGESLPSDHYYADLNDKMLPLLCVSRFPASTPAAMKQLCDTATVYPSQNDTWRNDVLLTTYNRDDYNKCKDTIAGRITPDFNPIKKYDGVATKADVKVAIGKGTGFINYRGHGAEDRWQAGNGLTNTDIPSLTNAGKLPHVLSIACNNNAIDYKVSSSYSCFGITWMREQKAISFLGASRPSYTEINHSFDYFLWEAIKIDKLERISEIFNLATTKLYLNNPGSLAIHNIYMYLLLGDPTANYKEKSMPTKTTGYVLMLDRSGTMRDAIGQVKINANSFVRKTLPNEQFGVVQFSNDADCIYPGKNKLNLVPVSGDLHETADAAKEIDKIVIQNMTNMGAAIKLGNSMISQASANNKAFVLLSDGLSNYGDTPPEKVLGAEPPIFIAGLGPYLKKEYFDKLLAKNTQSKYYATPIAPEMEMIFNDIRGLTPNTNIMANHSQTYTGSYYTQTKAMVNTDSEDIQISVAWADKKFTYTSGYPNGYNINVILMDPQNKKTDIKPIIVGEGYCIFNLNNAQPGEWSIVAQYSIEKDTKGITGAFQFGTSIKTNINAPNILSIGQPLYYDLNLSDDGNPIEGLKVDVQITQPIISVDNALIKYAKELNLIVPGKDMLENPQNNIPESITKLQALRLQKMKEGHGDILGVKYTTRNMDFSSKDGLYGSTFADTLEAGSYTLSFKASGVDPRTGKNISVVKQHSLLIG